MRVDRILIFLTIFSKNVNVIVSGYKDESVESITVKEAGGKRENEGKHPWLEII